MTLLLLLAAAFAGPRRLLVSGAAIEAGLSQDDLVARGIGRRLWLKAEGVSLESAAVLLYAIESGGGRLGRMSLVRHEDGESVVLDLKVRGVIREGEAIRTLLILRDISTEIPPYTALPLTMSRFDVGPKTLTLEGVMEDGADEAAFRAALSGVDCYRDISRAETDGVAFSYTIRLCEDRQQ